MAQITQREQLLSLLKTNDKGWNIQLFEDQSKLSICICTICKAVCCDAVESYVELGCDHDDDDIFLYCNNCLKYLIQTNRNGNTRMDPVIIPSRVLRQQILKSIVFCPYSTCTADKNDEKKDENKQCIWKGTLNELINGHITECTKTNNPSFALKSTINELQNKNKTLNEEIMRMHKELKRQKEQNKKYKKRLKSVQTDSLQQILIKSLQTTIKELQNELNTQKQKNKDMKTQLNIHTNNEQRKGYKQKNGYKQKKEYKQKNGYKQKKGVDGIFMPPPFNPITLTKTQTTQKRKVIKVKPKQKQKECASIWDINENAEDDRDSVSYKKRVILSNYQQSVIKPITEESRRRLALGIDAPSRTRLKSVFSDSSDEDDSGRLTVNVKKAKHNQKKVNSHFVAK